MVTSWFGRHRSIGNTIGVLCVTEIMELDGRYGLYVRPGEQKHEQRELHGEFPCRWKARNAARYRRRRIAQ